MATDGIAATGCVRCEIKEIVNPCPCNRVVEVTFCGGWDEFVETNTFKIICLWLVCDARKQLFKVLKLRWYFDAMQIFDAIFHAWVDPFSLSS